eukprot:TRINITY_DN26661_c1_g2_i4.p3 TRINITY_DN26661_c1_g2~~TRINITY_DN26661_c1_g2_i4.p3  ORF type:complete len:139 (+),score=14.48 TRINITY_DN26661_c1_g2_i4:295-711(+)
MWLRSPWMSWEARTSWSRSLQVGMQSLHSELLRRAKLTSHRGMPAFLGYARVLALVLLDQVNAGGVGEQSDRRQSALPARSLQNCGLVLLLRDRRWRAIERVATGRPWRENCPCSDVPRYRGKYGRRDAWENAATAAW